MIANDKSTLLTTRDKETIQKTEIPSLVSTQEETDTRVVLYAKYAQEHGYDYAQINTPDSDIFFILLHYAASLSPTKILYKTGSGNNKMLINISELAESYGEDYSTSLLAYHTHCDQTSAFKGKGKVRPLSILE